MDRIINGQRLLKHQIIKIYHQFTGRLNNVERDGEINWIQILIGFIYIYKIIREPWNSSDDVDLLYLILENGKKWANIVKLLGKKRTEFSLKHRFSYLLREY